MINNINNNNNMFASTSFSSVLNNTDIAFSSSSSSAYSSPPGSPFISVPMPGPTIGQKRSQRKPPSPNPLISTSLSSNNMSSMLNNSAYSYEQVTTTLTRTPSAYHNTTINTSTLTPSCSLISNAKITVPKSPKPQRTLLILDSVISGLNLCIDDLKNKVSELTLAVTNGYNAMAKQLLQSEAYLRHLELRISNLIKLKNSYIIHLKMRDGIQNMYDAYKKTPSKNQIKNLNNIKTGWKKCIKTLCLIEAQTEALLGTFKFQIEKLIGFARLCPGDVYQLQIKYGSSKFRTRTKISKDCNQMWDNQNFCFKITIHDLLLIKINEIKFFGKNVSIGERYFDIKDLFSTTQTQRLTINANTSGTIKLSMLITWMPLENCEDNFTFYNPTQLVSIKNKDKRTTLAKSNSFSEKQIDYPLSSTIQIRPNSLLLNSINDSKLSNLSAITDQDDDESKLGTPVSSSTTSSSSSLTNSKLESKTSENLIISSENRYSIKSISSNETTNSFEYSKSDSQLSSESLQEDILPQVESLLNDLIDKIESNDQTLIDLDFQNLKTNINDLRSVYIELNDFYDCLNMFECLFNRNEEKNKSSDKLNNLDLSLETEEDCVMLDEVLHEYFDFLDLESDSDSLKLFTSTNNERKNSKLSNGCVKAYDYNLLFMNHFNNIKLILDDLNYVNKNQSRNEKICTNQSKIEQVILDSLNYEFDLMKNIYNFFNKSKNLLTESNKQDLVNLFYDHNDDEKISVKKDLWLKSIDEDNFFCAQIANLRENFVHFLNLETNFVHFFEPIIEKYLSIHSFSANKLTYISLYYFNQIYDLFDQIVQIFRCKTRVENLIEPMIEQILIQQNQNKVYLSELLFSHILTDLCNQDTNITCSLKKFLDADKLEKNFNDMLLMFFVKQSKSNRKFENLENYFNFNLKQISSMLNSD